MRSSLFLFCLLGILSCTNQQKEANNATENAIPAALKPSAEKQPILKVDKPYVSLGKITEGDSVVAQHLRQLNNSFHRYLVCKFHHVLHEKHLHFGSRFVR
jgi:hypothetical protein